MSPEMVGGMPHGSSPCVRYVFQKVEDNKHGQDNPNNSRYFIPKFGKVHINIGLQKKKITLIKMCAIIKRNWLLRKGLSHPSNGEENNNKISDRFGFKEIFFSKKRNEILNSNFFEVSSNPSHVHLPPL